MTQCVRKLMENSGRAQYLNSFGQMLSIPHVLLTSNDSRMARSSGSVISMPLRELENVHMSGTKVDMLSLTENTE